MLKDYNAIGSGQGGDINTFLKMGLTGVLSTQLWHHLYMGGGLCELPDHSARPQVERPPAPVSRSPPPRSRSAAPHHLSVMAEPCFAWTGADPPIERLLHLSHGGRGWLDARSATAG